MRLPVCLLVVSCLNALSAQTITVTAGDKACSPTPLSVLAPAGVSGGVALIDERTSRRIPAQVEKTDDGARLWWIERELKPGERRRYRLTRTEEALPGVRVRQGDTSVEVKIADRLFTRYVFTGATKPYCYPIIGPTGKPVTRSYPMESVEGERKDHSHHRSGFWFGHGDVNGIDFWSEGSKSGLTRHREFLNLVSGPVFGLIRAANDRMTRDGQRVFSDVRELRIFNTEGSRLVDFAIDLRASEGDIVFGDTKEGSFGFRVAHTMRLKGGQGHILNAAGQRDNACWGKAAAWCDYSGPVDGDAVGIAIFDSPQNLRHPTYWHVRDYGLFAANPFGLKYFIKDKTGKGRYTVHRGEVLTLRYRVYIHKGDAKAASVARAYETWTHPPNVQLTN